MRYLSGQYLLNPAGPRFHFLWPAVLFFILMGLAAMTYSYFVEETNNKRAPISRMARRVQSVAWTIAVVGLILIGFRMGDAQIPVLESRLALYVVALGFVALLVYVLCFLRFTLPKRNAAYETTLLRRQYQPRRRRR